MSYLYGLKRANGQAKEGRYHREQLQIVPEMRTESFLFLKFVVFELSCLCVFLVLSNKLRSLIDLVAPPYPL